MKVWDTRWSGFPLSGHWCSQAGPHYCAHSIVFLATGIFLGAAWKQQLLEEHSSTFPGIFSWAAGIFPQQLMLASKPDSSDSRKLQQHLRLICPSQMVIKPNTDENNQGISTVLSSSQNYPCTGICNYYITIPEWWQQKGGLGCTTPSRYSRTKQPFKNCIWIYSGFWETF